MVVHDIGALGAYSQCCSRIRRASGQAVGLIQSGGIPCDDVQTPRPLYAHRGHDNKPSIIGEFDMLETIAIILVVLWALGMVSSYTMGGLVHILLVVAIVVILIRVIQGRRI